MKPLTIKRLEFLLTDKCNSRCIHCQGEHSPEKEGVMTTEDGTTYLEEATSVTKLDSFMIFGGESMLYPQRTIELFQKAHSLGIPEIELITNGSWGRNRKRALRLASQLKDAGVSDVSISVDAFHLPYIPLSSPRNAALASLAVGIKKVVWNVAILEGINASNTFDRQTSEILKILEPVGLEVHTNSVWPQGRARTTLKQFFTKQSLDGRCLQAENTLISPACLTMDPEGWASICWNLSIGNAKKERLSRMLSRYDWKDHPVIQTLVERGPKALIELPEADGFSFNEEKYIDRCHLCTDVRKFLKPEYPETFTQL